MTISVLVIADAHIGRYPSKVPLDPQGLAVRAVWDSAIDYAIENRVNAVVLTGDIVDQGNKYFEAYGAVKHGVERLDSSDIDVFAVSGNHDYDVLPRLVDDTSLARFHLLGRGGTWEAKPLRIDGRVAAWFTGWSFPSAHCPESPLQSFRWPEKDEPAIGVVHGDLDAANSSYAPLALGELQKHPLSIWLLGHVHKPRYILSGGTPVLYPGSLQPLDPGEPGDHGPWLLNIDTAGGVAVQQVQLASVRYAKLTIDLTDAANLDDVDSRITLRVSEDADRLSRQYERLRHVAYRLELTGKSSLHSALATRSWTSLGDLDSVHGDLRASVNKVFVETTPARNLENIARFKDPPATVASWILELMALAEGGTGSPECDNLLDRALKAAIEIHSKPKFRDANEMALNRASVAELLVQQGNLLVDTLMAQKE